MIQPTHPECSWIRYLHYNMKIAKLWEQMEKVSTQSHDLWFIIITTHSDRLFHRKLKLQAIKRLSLQIKQFQTDLK